MLFLVSAFSAGAAATIIGSALFARPELTHLHGMKRLHIALPVVEGLLVAALLYITASANPAALQSTQRMLSGDLSMAFWLGLVVVGLCLPLALELLTLMIGRGSERLVDTDAARTAGGVLALDIAGGAGTLVGGFVLRYLIVFSAVPLVFVS